VADNFVTHMLVSDMSRWCKHVCALDLASLYGVKARAAQRESRGLVAGIVDPSTVL
jgi:hypothetical protein